MLSNPNFCKIVDIISVKGILSFAMYREISGAVRGEETIQDILKCVEPHWLVHIIKNEDLRHYAVNVFVRGKTYAIVRNDSADWLVGDKWTNVSERRSEFNNLYEAKKARSEMNADKSATIVAIPYAPKDVKDYTLLLSE